MEKINYPIKYSLLPVKARRTDRKGNEFIIHECYIVSKAYVMEEHIVFLDTGDIGGNYKVCYPYAVFTDGINLEKKTPIDYGKQDNEAVVFYLYDTFEEATADKEKKNILVPDKVVEKYQPFEDTIQDLTSDMIINNNKDVKVNIKRKI